MITDPDKVLEDNRKIHQDQLKHVKKVIDSMGQRIQAIAINCDLGSQMGPGCNTQKVLNTGTPEDVANNVRELVRIFKPGGGFVFNQVHNIMGDVKPENIVAMLDTAYEESFF